jgi:hypothetical protein
MVGKKPETAASTGSRVHGTYSGLSRQAAHGHHGKGGRDMRTVALRVATCQAAPVDYPWRVHCPRRGAALAVAQKISLLLIRLRYPYASASSNSVSRGQTHWIDGTPLLTKRSD